MTELRKQFKKDHPETIGETDSAFDNSNYIDWLEKKLTPLEEGKPSEKPDAHIIKYYEDKLEVRQRVIDDQHQQITTLQSEVESLKKQVEEEKHIANCQVEICKEKNAEVERLNNQLMDMAKPYSGEGADKPQQWLEWLDTRLNLNAPQKDYILFALREISKIAAQKPVKSAECQHPRNKRSYIDNNTLKCNVCGAEFN